MVLVFSISSFFIKKDSQGRKLSAKKIPTCSNSALLILYIDRLLLEALDELEVAFTHPQAKKTDGNHIFLNFVGAHLMFSRIL